MSSRGEKCSPPQIIPESVSSIGTAAFYGCIGLTSVELPSSLTDIGNYTFYGSTFLTEINIPEGIKDIPEGTFADCVSLTSVILPSTLESIGYYAFANCAALTEIHFNGTTAQWNAIRKVVDWNAYAPVETVVCSDGTVSLKALPIV